MARSLTDRADRYRAADTSPKSGKRLSDAQIGVLLVLPALILVAGVILYPLINSMWMAFLQKSLVFPGERFVGLENIERVLRRDFVQLLGTTLSSRSGRRCCRS